MNYGNLYWQNTSIAGGGSVWAVNIGDCLQFMLIDYLYSLFLPPETQIKKITMQEMRSYQGDQLIIPMNWSLFDINFMEGNNLAISDKITPVFLAMTIESWSYKDEYFNEHNIAYLKKYEPIGCRDEYTKIKLQEYGVKAYLNGCLSAILPRRRNKGNKVLLIDAPCELEEFLPEWSEEIETYTQQFYIDQTVSVESVIEKTKKIYEYMVSEASLVVTSRLHVASPCMAAGIPVIFAKNIVDARFSWLDRRLPLYDKSAFKKINWNPSSVEYEEDKKIIIENAIMRIQSQGKQNDRIMLVDLVYQLNQRKEYPSFQSTLYTNYDKVIQYLKMHFDDDSCFEYVLWGIGKAAENVYSFIREHYSNAKMVGALDLYKRGEFHGTIIENPEQYQKRRNEVIFVIPVQASNMANQILKKKGFNEDEYICAGDCFIQRKSPDFLK